MAGLDHLQRDWQNRLARRRAALVALSQTYAGRMESEMKSRAPWQDRTGNARNRLFGRAYVTSQGRDVDEVGIVLGHGMQYGVYLELGTRYMRIPPTTAYGRPMHVQSTGLIGYPIIVPTIYQYRDEFLDAARGLLT